MQRFIPTRLSDLTIIIRGAGEMASGTALRLHRSGFVKLLLTDIENPLAVRRMVSFCEALHHDTWTVEGVRAVKIDSPEDAPRCWKDRVV
ncbi:MAG: molybdenum hydroxylase, partial [Desulfomonilaceae bacterium]|nr:molybdenum hydroxylase [Desulfomonilaceae bacterium]